MQKPLPIGVDNFEHLITSGYYYVDKTLFIKELIDKKGSVNLFTRPRRFGKSLNLSMLRYFFEKTDKDRKHLFDGLSIMNQGEHYTRHMGEYPVISISLKHLKQGTFKEAIEQFKDDIAGEFDRHAYILESEKLPDYKKEQCRKILYQTATNAIYSKSLRFLSECLYAHHGKKTIILIDEYDVPLENAYFRGFYDEMTDFIRTLFESALKTNDFLEFAVMTGCLRISKESIFTGMNNLKIISIITPNYGEYFGFTEPEVVTMLKHYSVESKIDEARLWYNGYIFGDTTVYNPWSILNYVDWVREDIKQFPQKFWGNTSSNDIIRFLIDNSAIEEKQEIEHLIAGGSITKPICEDVTYKDIQKSHDNLWNFLLFTGYLKKVSERSENDKIYATLKIPNTEVRLIYDNNILEWFGEKIRSRDLSEMFHALFDKDIDTFQKELASILLESISYHDTKENFYHGFLLGILSRMQTYRVKSNRETGNGRSDIYIRPAQGDGTCAIIEIKVAKSLKELDKKCDEALDQIEKKRYAEELLEDGYQEVLRYGMAFYEKTCKIKVR